MSVVSVRWIERAAEVRNANSCYPSQRKQRERKSQYPILLRNCSRICPTKEVYRVLTPGSAKSVGRV